MNWTVSSAASTVTAKSVVDLVSAACVREPSKPILIFEDGLTLTRREFLDRAEAFAAYLAPRVKPGDRVAIMVGTRAEYMIAWLAVLANRAILVSINPSAGEHDGGHILRDSGSKVLIMGEEGHGMVRALKRACPSIEEVIFVNGEEPNGLAAYDAEGERLPFAAASVERADIANISYSSGTTGLPKGCMLDHSYWLRWVDLVTNLYRLTYRDRILCCLPFFYGDAPWQLLASFHLDTTLVVMRRFSVSRFWNVVRLYDITILYTIASIAALLLKSPPTTMDNEHLVRIALHYAIPPELHRQLVDRWGFPWIELYGLTEAGLVTAMPLEVANDMVGSGSIGIPCPGVAVRILEHSGASAAPLETGEILIRNPYMMSGYWNQPKATSDLVVGDWLHSGDMGWIDEHGFVYFAGRKKEIIRRSGENVSASEVEDVLRSHPKVMEAAVIPVPDTIRGEEVKAYVILVDGESDATLPPARLVEFCIGQLARFKVPRYFEYRSVDFARTPTMRVKKGDLLAERVDHIAGSWDRQSELGW